MSAEKSDARLLYFTESYPFGLGEEWKRVELEVFRDHFTSIEVVPLHYGGNTRAKPAIPGITYHRPLFPDGLPEPSRRECLRAILSRRDRAVFAREFVLQDVFKSRARLDRWLQTSCFAVRLAEHEGLSALLRVSPHKTVLYFFWARGISEVLPLIDTSMYRRTVLRLHNYDLYADSVQGWVPFQRPQIRKATELLTCSEHGAKYLLERYPEVSARVRTARLGTHSRGLCRPSQDGILRIVTCSMVLPVKRLHLLTSALALVHGSVHWTHIGDGELYEDLRRRADALSSRPNVKCVLLGRLQPGDVAKFYVDHPVDLFVNVSDSEGLPVSIMEAFAAGIPAFATAVAGTPEIVDTECGRLWPVSVDPEEIARDLDAFARLPQTQRQLLRERAFAKFNEMFDADRNARALAVSLK